MAKSIKKLESGVARSMTRIIMRLQMEAIKRGNKVNRTRVADLRLEKYSTAILKIYDTLLVSRSNAIFRDRDLGG